MNQQAQSRESSGYSPMPQTPQHETVVAVQSQSGQVSNVDNPGNTQLNLQDVLKSAQASFEKIATSVGLDIKFYEEAVYARQLIEQNHNNARNKNFSLANASPDSIKNALIQVANSGLTLSPQLGLAYLVPRWNGNAGCIECHLEPSYRGLRRLGIDSGAIDTAVAELVYEKDDFEWNDSFSKPDHNFDPFNSNRGKLRGGYCLARRPNGSFLATPVSLELIQKIEALSHGGIWKEWFEQMVKKTIIRQGFKDWPITTTGPIAQRLADMQQYLKEVDETTLEEQPVGLEDMSYLQQPPANITPARNHTQGQY